MRTACRPYLTAGVAVVAAAFVGVSPVTPKMLGEQQLRRVSLTNNGTVDLGDGIALLMGPSTLPIPPQPYLDAIDDVFLKTLHFGGVTQPLFTPEGLYPVTGVKSLEYDTSVAQGKEMLEQAILQQVHSPGFDPSNPVVVFGWSQSSGISSEVMADLKAQGVPGDDVHFVLVGDTNNPSGGMFERFTGLAPHDPTLAPLGFTLGGAPTPVDLYSTEVYTNEYDVVGDFPRYPIDILSDLNAAVGIVQHIVYPALDPGQIAGADELVTTSADTMAHFFMIPAETLPLLWPLQLLPVVGQPLYDLLEPDTRILVNLGYGNIEHGWDTGPADLTTPFGLLPANTDGVNGSFNWGDVLPALGNGLVKGVTAAIGELRNPANYSLSSITDNQLLNQLIDVVHVMGYTDATTVSEITSLSDLLEMARNGLGGATGFPTPDVSIFSSSPTEIINALTATVAADYATLLPIADGINTLLTSVPAYDLSVITHQLEDGNLLAAVVDPLLADETLALFGPVLAAPPRWSPSAAPWSTSPISSGWAASGNLLGEVGVSGAQVAFEDLAAGVLRQGVDDREVLRRLVAGQARPAERGEVVGVDAVSLARHDRSDHRLDPLRVGDAEHGDLANRGMPIEHFLDFAAGDVLPAGFDHVLHSIDHGDATVGVHHPDVAAVEPAVAEGRGGLVRFVPVAERGVRAAVHDLALDARRHRFVVGIDQPRLDIERGPAGCAKLAMLVLGRQHQRECRHLGLSVEVEQPHARQTSPQFLYHLDRHDRRAVVALLQRRQVAGLEVRVA